MLKTPPDSRKSKDKPDQMKPDRQGESFLDFLIPEAKQPIQEAVSPNLFEFLGGLFPPKPRYQFYVSPGYHGEPIERIPDARI